MSYDPNFFLTDNVAFGDWFQYVKHISPVVFRSENIEGTVKKYLKLRSEPDFEGTQIFDFASFFRKTFTSKPSSSAKNHRRDMFYILKAISKLNVICEKKNQGRTTRGSENIEVNVKKYLKIKI